MAKENYHDKGYRGLLSKKRNFVKFLHHFVDGKWVKLLDEESLHLCDKGFIDSFFKELESDLIYSAKIDGRDVYFYVLTELQSSVDFTMPFRIFKYISAILIREFNNTPEDVRKRADYRLPLVIPIVFYNGEFKWSATRCFKEYLQGGDLFEGVIDFQYTLVDINSLDSNELLKNHDAICAAIAVDKIRGEDFEQLYSTLAQIMHSKLGFGQDEFDDFLAWLKHTLTHRTGSEEEAGKVIKLIEEGDEVVMRTGIDILFDNVEARGEARGKARGEAIGADKATIENAVKLVQSGMTITEVSNRLQFTEEQVEKLEIRLGVKKEFA